MTNSDSLSNIHELTVVESLTPNQELPSSENDTSISESGLTEVLPLRSVAVSPADSESHSPATSVGTNTPPPPPPPPVLPVKSLDRKNITRLPQGQIYWMKKTI